MKKKSKIKDHILKKCSWFYKFEDIFHKYLTISSSILIDIKQPVCRDGANVNDSEMRGFDSDSEGTLKAHREIEDTELRLSLGNHDGNDNSDSNLPSVFSQIALDERCNKIQKQQVNADQQKKLERMTKPWGSDIPNKSETENTIAFAHVDVSCSTQLSYLKSRRDCLEYETPFLSNSQNYNLLSNQERVENNNWTNV